MTQIFPSQSRYHTPVFAGAILVLTLLQASTFNLSLAFRGPLASDQFVSLITLLWLAMYALTTLGLFVSFGINWITWLVRYRLLLTLLLAGTVSSVAWSVDSALTLERSIHLVGTTIIALYLGFSLPLNAMLKISAVVLGLIMLSSVGAALLVPDLGLESYQGQLAWAGTLASKNTLGFWAAITILLCASLLFWPVNRSQRLMYLFFAAIAALCLYQSVSATSLLAFFSAGLIMLYFHAAFSIRVGLIAMLFLGVLVAGLLGVAFHFIDTAELIGRSGDLTGRGDVWSQTWQLILERPLTGYGYGTLWFPTAETIGIQQALTDFSWTVYHAHNGLLHIASEIGLPLTALAVFMIVQQIIEIIYCQYQRQQPGVLFVLGFTVALLLSNYSEARLLVNRELFWVFFIAMPVSMLMQVSLVNNQSSTVPSTGAPLSVDYHRLRTLRLRKVQKHTTKDRIRGHNRVRVINPDGTRTQSDSNLPNHQGVIQRRKPSSQPTTVDEDINRWLEKQDKTNHPHNVEAQTPLVNQRHLARLKKNRRLKKAG